MLNYIFLCIMWLFVAIGLVGTIQLLRFRKWRWAVLNGVLTIFTPLETVLFTMQRNVSSQTELDYFLQQLTNLDMYAYLILFLNLLLIGFSCFNLYKVGQMKMTKKKNHR